MLQVPNGYVLLPIPQTQLEYSMTENKNYAAAGSVGRSGGRRYLRPMIAAAQTTTTLRASIGRSKTFPRNCRH
jgi:hypothetical protein